MNTERAYTRPEDLQNKGPFGDWQNASKPGTDLEGAADKPQDAVMSDITRDEIKSMLAASQEQVRASLAEMRADNAVMKAEVVTALSGIKSEISTVRADFSREQVAATRWQIGLIITVLLAAMGGILTTVVRTSGKGATPAPPAVVQPASPVVIQLPAQQTPAPAPAQPATQPPSTTP